MKYILGVEEEKLIKQQGLSTAREIAHQPRLWEETLTILQEQYPSIVKHISTSLVKSNLRIIFTGAGTSAYIGEIAAPYLRQRLGLRVDSIATTDIVSNPDSYLEKNVPTLLVSFARSGDSPESIATYELAEELVEDVSQIVITCNKAGQLAQKAFHNPRNLVLLMPEKSNDQGFAMTSSFTCMLIAAVSIFGSDSLIHARQMIDLLIPCGVCVLENTYAEVMKIVHEDFDRVVYLGSGGLHGLAKEAALKMLELTSGKVAAIAETALGFRHGPKSIVTGRTLIVMFLSNNQYTINYEMDLLKELDRERGENKIAVITSWDSPEICQYADYVFNFDGQLTQVQEEVYVAPVYVLYAQILALLTSLKHGVTPDNPRPDGTVNRVVKGVSIYKFS